MSGKIIPQNWHNIPEGWSLFFSTSDLHGKSKIVCLVPSDIWHFISEYLPPIDVLRLRCNHFLVSEIRNAFYWKTKVELLFPKSTYKADTAFEKFLHNQKIQYHMRNEKFDSTVVNCFESEDLKGRDIEIHLSEKHLFVGNNLGIIQWFDRENLKKIQEQKLDGSIESLKEIDGVLYATALYSTIYSGTKHHLYLIDLDSKEIRFCITSLLSFTYKLPFYVLGNTLYVVNSSKTIGVYDLKSGKLEKEFAGICEKEETIVSLTINEEQDMLYVLQDPDQLATPSILKVKVFDLKKEIDLESPSVLEVQVFDSKEEIDLESPSVLEVQVFDSKEEIDLEKDIPEKRVQVGLSHLFDLITELEPTRPEDGLVKFNFEGSEIYSFSPFGRVIKSWKINIEDKCLSPILPLTYEPGDLEEMGGGMKGIFFEDYLFTSGNKIQKVWKRTGGTLGKSNQPLIRMNTDGRCCSIAAYGASLAIAYITREIVLQEIPGKILEIAGDLFLGNRNIWDFEHKESYRVKILNFDPKPEKKESLFDNLF